MLVMRHRRLTAEHAEEWQPSLRPEYPVCDFPQFLVQLSHICCLLSRVLIGKHCLGLDADSGKTFAAILLLPFGFSDFGVGRANRGVGSAQNLPRLGSVVLHSNLEGPVKPAIHVPIELVHRSAPSW